MPSTSNFGWSTPADTDLVKDGALAIRTLGNNIDASLVDLKGGTTGQILSKNSNSDLDYTWINNDQGDITEVQAGTGISVASGTGPVPVVTNTVATTFDAKGDLVVGTGADTFAKLTTGSSGDTLVADSSTTTGLRWQSMPISQPVINGGFDIWQRGTSIAGAASATYAADRWQMVGNTASTCSRQATGDTTNLPFIQYAARVQRTNGSTSTTRQSIVTSLESANSIPYAGRTITWSFYARRGANFSATSNLLGTGFYTGTGTDQNILTGFTGLADTYGSFTLTTSWQRFTQTVNVGATATQIALQFYYDPPAGTAGANDWFEVTGVQIDLGSSPLAFRRSGGTLAGELAACQRYYFRLDGSGQYDSHSDYGPASSTTRAWLTIRTPVRMRAVPTVFDASTAGRFMLHDAANNNFTVTGIAIDTPPLTVDYVTIYADVASGLTQYRTYALQNGGTGDSFIGFGAEL